jgi:hypothetical protein
MHTNTKLFIQYACINLHTCYTAHLSTILETFGPVPRASAVEGRPCLSRRQSQAQVAVACTLRRERECVALLAVRVGVRSLAGVGRIGGAGGDVADWDAFVLEVVKNAVGLLILRLAGPFSRTEVDCRCAARAVFLWNVEDGQPIAFERPAATTGWCVRVCMCTRAWLCAWAPCGVPLWRCKCSAYSVVRLGFAQNAAGTAPVSVLFLKSISVTAGSKAIESGMVPTKRFCWRRLHRNMRESSIIPGPSFCEPDALRQRFDRNNAAVEKRGRRYIVTRSTSLPIEASIAPSREFPDKSLQEYQKRRTLATEKEGSIVLHQRTLMATVCVTEGLAVSIIINGSPARSTRVPVALPRPSRIQDSLE